MYTFRGGCSYLADILRTRGRHFSENEHPKFLLQKYVIFFKLWFVHLDKMAGFKVQAGGMESIFYEFMWKSFVDGSL